MNSERVRKRSLTSLTSIIDHHVGGRETPEGSLVRVSNIHKSILLGVPAVQGAPVMIQPHGAIPP
jgi:hypothetical protein